MNGRPWRSWRVASALGKTRWFCWADLVSWVLEPAGRSEERLADTRGVDSCRRDAAASGICSCGMYRTPAWNGGQAGLARADHRWQVVQPEQPDETPRDEFDRLVALSERRVARIRRYGPFVVAAVVLAVLALLW